MDKTNINCHTIITTLKFCSIQNVILIMVSTRLNVRINLFCHTHPRRKRNNTVCAIDCNSLYLIEWKESTFEDEKQSLKKRRNTVGAIDYN